MSPTVFKQDGYRFFFFSREEPRMHIHVCCADGETKFWLEPQIELAKNYGLSRRQLNRHGRIQNILATHGYENTDWFFNMVLCVFMVKEIEKIIEERYEEIKNAWKKVFGC